MRRRLPRRDGKQKRKRKTTATNKTSKKNLNSPPQKNISHFSDSHKHSSLAFVHLLSFLTNPFYIIQQGREIREQGERRAILNINHELSLLFFFHFLLPLVFVLLGSSKQRFYFIFSEQQNTQTIATPPARVGEGEEKRKTKKALEKFLEKKKKTLCKSSPETLSFPFFSLFSQRALSLGLK